MNHFRVASIFRRDGASRSHSDQATWQDLLARFLAALRNRAPSPELWRLIVGHRWYQDQLDRCARRVLRRSGVPVQWLDDVKHEAVLLLAKALDRRRDLNLDRRRAGVHFPGWLATIITRQCQSALRPIRRQRQRMIPMGDREIGREPRLDLSLDLRSAMKRLSPELRRIIASQAIGRSLEEIAAEQQLSYWKARRLLERGHHELRQVLKCA
jgi:RNA polymerase sigma factor (sigma-70 family)